jgi:uncharacterized membrane protein (DUF373 family)
MRIPDTQDIFRWAVRSIVIVLTLIIILVLAVGLLRTLYGIRTIFSIAPIGQSFDNVVIDILTFLVIIELFRSFIDYFESHRFRLNTMIDPAIVFVIRELVVKLYEPAGIDGITIIAFAVLLLSLGIVRSLAVKYSPGEEGLPAKK